MVLLSLSLRLLLPLRGVAYSTLSRSYLPASVSVKENPPRILWKRSSLKPDQAARIKLEARAANLGKDLGWGFKDQYVVTLSELCEEGKLTDAVETLSILVQQGYDAGSRLFFRIVKGCFACVLKRCIIDKDLVSGKRVHALCRHTGHEVNSFLANHIIRMYASHGNMEEALQVFNKVAAPTTHMWASIVQGYAEHGQPKQGIGLYQQMCRSTLRPNSYVFVAVLQACAKAGDLASGKQVHMDLLKSGLEGDVFVGSCLVDMYAKCGSLEEAQKVFDRLPTKNVVTWNAMIGGYAQNGRGREALNIYASMQRDSTTAANHVTFVSLLQACASIKALHEGAKLHADIQGRGLESDVVVGSCLVDMYAKCGALEAGRQIFDRLPQRNVVTWTAMIAGYAQQGMGQEGLSLYASMQRKGIIPNEQTYVCLLKACASVGAVSEGNKIHAQIQQRGLEANVVVGNSLVDMYAKCGKLDDARRVFDTLPIKNVVTWNALLNGYAHHSAGKMVMHCFEEMRRQGVEPDDATFLCLLVACSHEGLVNEGQRYFKMMVEDTAIVPTVLHYNCVVDLLGRSGYLDEAEKVLQNLPFESPVGGWRSLLNACKSHGDIERGKRCFDHIVALEPENATAYVLMGNIYANAGRWSEVDRVEHLRKSAGAWKKPAQACIEVKNKVHEFTVGEERADISTKLRSMNLNLKEGGHVPHTELVLHAVSRSEKEDALCGHAEKLALAYGLLNTPDGTTLMVTKNLRMCNDCHSGTKILSRLEKREIIVRDAHRIHHFQDGFCSCGDWH